MIQASVELGFDIFGLQRQRSDLLFRIVERSVSTSGPQGMQTTGASEAETKQAFCPPLTEK